MLTMKIVSAIFASTFFVSVLGARASLHDGVYSVKARDKPIYEDCTKPGGIFSYSDVSITPDPPQIGKDVTVSLNFNTTEEITKGTIDISLSIGDTPVAQTLPLCIALDLVNIGIKCPIPKGPGKIHATAQIPDTSPGKLTGTVTVTNGEKEFLCLKLDFYLA